MVLMNMRPLLAESSVSRKVRMEVSALVLDLLAIVLYPSTEEDGLISHTEWMMLTEHLLYRQSHLSSFKHPIVISLLLTILIFPYS